MGDDYSQIIPREGPQHRVLLTKPFAISVHEVTQGQFRKFVEATGYKTDAEKDGKGGYGYKKAAGKQLQSVEFLWNTDLGFDEEQTNNHPVVNVSWNDVVAFCKWLSEKEGVAYRFPTEAEWEYSCRAGTMTRFSFGGDESLLQEHAWCGGTVKGIPRTPRRIGVKRPSSFGLFDMHGNVAEWCRDRFGSYATTIAVDPAGSSNNRSHVIRGGSFIQRSLDMRSAYRGAHSQDFRQCDLGFRIVRTFEKPKADVAGNPYARDRAAAEWVLSVGGTVRVASRDGAPPAVDLDVSSADELPDADFTLRWVNFGNNRQLTAEGLSKLVGLPNFGTVIAQDSNLDGRGLQILARCPRLYHLMLHRTSLKSSDLRVLSSAAQLMYLSVSPEQIDDGWEFLSELKEVRQLRIYGRPVPDIVELGNHPQLHTVEFRSRFDVDPADLGELQRRNPNLRIVIASGSEWKSAGVLGADRVLDAARGFAEAGWTFEGVHFDGSEWKSQSASAWDRERPFQIQMVFLPDACTLSAQDGRLLPRLTHHYHSIKAPGLQNADEVAPFIADCRMVGGLYLGHSDLTDKGLAALSELLAVGSLYVHRTRVTEPAVRAFKARFPRCIVVSDFGTFENEHKLPEGWEGAEPVHAPTPR